MATKLNLEASKDVFMFIDLLKKAAGYKGLKIQESSKDVYSESIKTYVLDQPLLDFLEKKGIRGGVRDDHRGMFTLVDENPQEEIPGQVPSNYWNFILPDKKGAKFDLRIDLFVGFGFRVQDRGITFYPRARGTFLSPCDELPNMRMFNALVESDKNAPAIAKELAASDGEIVVGWTELGFGGIRSISNLFEEFAKGNKNVEHLARTQKVFNPEPFSMVEFIAEPAQPKLFAAWSEQLEEYRLKLMIY